MFADFRMKLSRSARRARKSRPRFVPQLLQLEDRTLPSVYIVTSLSDSGTGSLRDALASGDSTIDFAPGMHGTITLSSGELVVNSSVTINGPGADKIAVSGNNAGRVFEVASGFNVTIDGLTITKGYAPDSGGGIQNDGSSLTLSGDEITQNVVFASATSAGRGGGLRSVAGILTISDCEFTGNEALGATGPSNVGDAIGGGLYIFAGSASITDTSFSDNIARGGDGSSDGNAVAGAIEVVANTTITNCSFTGNQAFGSNGGTGGFVGDAFAGAINLATTGAATLNVSGSTFDNNVATAGSNGNSGVGNSEVPFVDYGFGAAIYAGFGSTLNVTTSDFSHNQAIGGNNGTAVATDIAAVGGAEGGAILNEVNGVANFTDCTFDHNNAIGGNGNSGNGALVLVGEGLGGAIVSGYGGSEVGPNTTTVSDSVITHNTAQGGDRNTGTATVAGLVGTGAGAGLANYVGGTATISNSELDHNQASGGHHNTSDGGGTVFANLGAGGAIFNYLCNYTSIDVSLGGYGPLGPSVVNVSNCLIDHNQAQAVDHGIAEGGSIANVLDASTTVQNSVITQNQVNGSGAGYGGGAYNDATSTLALMDSSVTKNHVDGSPGVGGGIYTLGIFTFDASTVIKDNHASTDDDNIGP
jgi:hypothetical protein